MKRRLLNLCLISGLLSFASCETDLDPLQEQIDGLTEQVADLETAQQEALLTQIAQLQALITALQGENSDLAADYELLLQNLQALQDAVEAGDKAIHYGNVLTDADFAAVAESGASIITGKVAATSQAHIDALANVTLIGGYLEINGGTTVDLPNLENVAGDLMISGVNEEAAVVALPKLASVGGHFEMTANQGVVSVDADELVLIYGKLSMEENAALASVSMTKLDVVNELYINDYDKNDPNYIGFGLLADLDLSQTDVKNDVYVSYLPEGAKLSLGNIGNDFVLSNTGVDTLMLLAETIPGKFTLEYNGYLKEINLDLLTRIEGNLDVTYNRKQYMWGEEIVGLTSLSGFDNLEFIGGDVNVSYNEAIDNLDAFNNVTEVQGTSIEIKNNGKEKELVNIFTSLTTTGPSKYSHANITISEKTDWFTGFTALEKAKDVNIHLQRTMDASYEKGEVCRFDGFDALIELNTLDLQIQDLTEFNAFPVLNKFKKYGEYLKITFLESEALSLCSMSDLLTRIKSGELDNQGNANVKATFIDSYTYSELDRTVAIDLLLTDCN